MPKRPKYKRGFTLGHYFDEWWDRVGVEFKIKLFISLLVIGLIGTVLGFYCWHENYEKKELLDAARIRKEQEPKAEMETARYQLSQKPIPVGMWSPRED
jgi:hypothetical protein